MPIDTIQVWIYTNQRWIVSFNKYFDMETATLPLFEFSNPQPTAKSPIADNDPERLVTENKLIVPLTQVLDHITPSIEHQPKQSLETSQTFKQSLDDLFPEQKYEDKDIQKAKEILGSLVNEFTPEQLSGTIIEIQYLAQSWLDDLEREIFKGLTLKEVLHEKGAI